MQSMPILTIQSAGQLLDALDDFLDKSEAGYALVIDRGGSILSQHGAIPPDTDTQIVAVFRQDGAVYHHATLDAIGYEEIRRHGGRPRNRD